jgi:tetratricopeptide (TPR) repeat protein
MNYRRHTDEKIIKEYCPSHNGNIFSKALEGQPIGSGSTLLVRRSVAKNVKFDIDIDRGIDGDFIRRVCREYYVDYVPEILVEYYVEHGKDRITSKDESRIRDAISGHKTKFDKFSTELNARPQRASRILAQIAYLYAQLGEWRMSIEYYQKAVSRSPTSLAVYRSILSSIKTGIDRYGRR